MIKLHKVKNSHYSVRIIYGEFGDIKNELNIYLINFNKKKKDAIKI